jgi:hypothetical protein
VLKRAERVYIEAGEPYFGTLLGYVTADFQCKNTPVLGSEV